MRRFYHPNLDPMMLQEAKTLPLAPSSATESVSQDGGFAGFSIQLDQAESRHISKVLRLKSGDQIELFDGAGALVKATITDTTGKQVSVTANAVFRAEPAKGPKLVIAAALPKSSRATDMIEQLVQLGADEFIPLATKRGVVEIKDNKIQKLERTAIEASKQSERLYLMTIRPKTDFSKLLTESSTEHALFLSHPISRAPELAHTLINEVKDQIRGKKTVTILIGPEGGWTDEEIHLAINHQAQAIELGPHIMRVETAATCAAALFKQQICDMIR